MRGFWTVPVIASILVLGFFNFIPESYFEQINSSLGVYGYEDSNPDNISSNPSCNCVAFRLDDIADGLSNDVEIQVINTFLEKNIPITIGIIGSKFGDDPQITNFIKEKLETDRDKLEIANHGWDHESFPQFNRNDQQTLIKQTNDHLYEILGVSPKVFIPPYNDYDSNTMKVLKENGFTHMSSGINKDNPPYPFQGEDVYRFPAAVSTGTTTWLSRYIALPSEIVFEGIEESISKYGFAVVMMHPKEFFTKENGKYTHKVNFDQIHELELLIEKVQDEGLDIVPISEINQRFVPSQEIQERIKNNASWWDQLLDFFPFSVG